MAASARAARQARPSAATRRARHLILAALLPAFLAGCAKPVPPEKVAYVGDWLAPEMELHIEAQGSVYYRRVRAGSSRSLDLPLRGFQGDNIVVGVGPLSTTFEVSAPHTRYIAGNVRRRFAPHPHP